MSDQSVSRCPGALNIGTGLNVWGGSVEGRSPLGIAASQFSQRALISKPMSVHANQIAVLWQSMSMRRQPTNRREFFIQPKVSPDHLLWNFSQKLRRLFREHDKSSHA